MNEQKIAPVNQIQWPVLPPSRGQSHVLFDDGYTEGWSKCLADCQAAALEFEQAVLARVGANEHQIIAAFLERSGQWLTNEATHAEYARQVREQALEDAQPLHRPITAAERILDGIAWQDPTAAPQSSSNPGPLAAVEMPEAVRLPLDSLHADAGYLIGRVIDGTMSSDVATGVIRSRIDAVIAASKEGASHG